MSRIFDPRNPNVPRPVVVVPPEQAQTAAILAALDQLGAAIAERTMPAPIVEVAAPDLFPIIQAVQALKGPATADEIAEAMVRAMGVAPTQESSSAALAEVAAALKKLDFRLQGVGTQAYGGGSVSFSDTGLRQLMDAWSDPSTESVTPLVATVTATGETTILTPTTGRALRVLWVAAINDPDQAQSPLVQVKLGSTELYRAYAVAHRQTFTGAVNAALTVTLDQAGSVAVTVHYTEV